MNRIDNTTNKPALRVCVPGESAWPLPMARGHQWPRCEAMASSPAGGVESPLGPFGHSVSQFLLRRSPEINVWGISWCLLLLHGCGCCKDKASHWACRARAPLALCPQGMSPALLSLQTCPCVVLHIQRNKMSLPGHLGASNIFLIVPLLSGASMPGVTRPLPKECSRVLFAPVVASRKVIKAL